MAINSSRRPLLMRNLSACDSLLFLDDGPAVVGSVSGDGAGWMTLLFDIVLVEGRVNGGGYGKFDGGDDGSDTNNGEGGRRKGQQQSERWTVDGGQSQQHC